MAEKNLAHDAHNARVNLFVLIVMTIIDVLLFGGYVVNYTQGYIGLIFMSAIVSVIITSLVLSYIIFLRRRDSNVFKYVSLFGYIAVYTIAMIGGVNDYAFIMAFPITVLYILYYDYRFQMKTISKRFPV